MEWLKRKEMGLPIWAWVVIASIVLFVGYKWLKGRSSGGSSGSGPLTGATTGTDSGVPSNGSSGSSDTTDGIDTGSTPPELLGPPDSEPSDINNPEVGTGEFLPGDSKQRTAVKSTRNTAALRNVLKKAVTKSPVNRKKTKVKVKAKPTKTPAAPVAKRTAVPVTIQKKTTPIPAVKAVPHKPAQPLKKAVRK